MLTVVLCSLLVVLLAVITNAQNPGDACVIPDPLRSGLYAAHPTDCGQYLQCLHGTFVARLCPRGLHWSTFHVTCNWPAFANCNTSQQGPLQQPFEVIN